MHFATIAAALFAGLAAAAPSQKARGTDAVEARGADVECVKLTFWAAAENEYSQDIPVDGSKTYIGNGLSFTYITSDAHESNIVCQAYGKDGSVTTLYGPAYKVPIGPPQVQEWAKCWKY